MREMIGLARHLFFRASDQVRIHESQSSLDDSSATGMVGTKVCFRLPRFSPRRPLPGTPGARVESEKNSSQGDPRANNL